jgi:predicted transcriptional regulator
MPTDHRRAAAGRITIERSDVPDQLATARAPSEVSELMISTPKTLPIDTQVEAGRRAFEDSHVHMLLLTHRGILCGTLLRSDLQPGLPPNVAALPLATVRGRTVRPEQRISTIHQWMVRSGQRRLAVVNDDGRLLGLLCLTSDRTGFCTDEGVAAREADRTASLPPILCDTSGQLNDRDSRRDA